MQTEGIVLRLVPLRDDDQIASLFTRDFGVIKLVVRKGRGRPQIEPLTRSEITFSTGRSDLCRCHTVHVVDRYVKVRDQLICLQVACDLLNIVQAHLPHDRPFPLLYQLLIMFLDHVTTVVNPAIFSVLFRLKILQHEGLCDFAKITQIPFVDREWDWICELMEHRTLAALPSLPPDIDKKIDQFFESRMDSCPL